MLKKLQTGLELEVLLLMEPVQISQLHLVVINSLEMEENGVYLDSKNS